MYNTRTIVSDCPVYIEKPNEARLARRRITAQDRKEFDCATIKEAISHDNLQPPLYVTTVDAGIKFKKDHITVYETIFYFHYDQEIQKMVSEIYDEIQKESDAQE